MDASATIVRGTVAAAAGAAASHLSAAVAAAALVPAETSSGLRRLYVTSADVLKPISSATAATRRTAATATAAAARRHASAAAAAAEGETLPSAAAAAPGSKTDGVLTTTEGASRRAAALTLLCHSSAVKAGTQSRQFICKRARCTYLAAVASAAAPQPVGRVSPVCAMRRRVAVAVLGADAVRSLRWSALFPAADGAPSATAAAALSSAAAAASFASLLRARTQLNAVEQSRGGEEEGANAAACSSTSSRVAAPVQSAAAETTAAVGDQETAAAAATNARQGDGDSRMQEKRGSDVEATSNFRESSFACLSLKHTGRGGGQDSSSRCAVQQETPDPAAAEASAAEKRAAAEGSEGTAPTAAARHSTACPRAAAKERENSRLLLLQRPLREFLRACARTFGEDFEARLQVSRRMIAFIRENPLHLDAQRLAKELEDATEFVRYRIIQAQLNAETGGYRAIPTEDHIKRGKVIELNFYDPARMQNLPWLKKQPGKVCAAEKSSRNVKEAKF